MPLFNTIANWFDKDREHFVYQRIDRSRSRGQAVGDQKAQAGLHYFRLWLSEMFLSKQVAWFQSLYPAVYSLSRLNFGSQPSVEIPNIADATRLGINPSGGQG